MLFTFRLVSDLIGNHLTMSLYNHAAIWPDQPESKWPRSFFTNGHVMIDHEKMSKVRGKRKEREWVGQEGRREERAFQAAVCWLARC